eukprot:TRINITY_DN2791_c0_g1_i1.p1 TRINITY_DN2791_c0_g1~~TRINITY_DN2791_c0_g1_i1.p1  ORF type:complete len:85 (-),score=9.77 TRINITY_DN2791_c0_g1_i1:111-365(-)
MGMRVCTRRELQHGESQNTGCSIDKNLVYSQTECSKDGTTGYWASTWKPYATVAEVCMDPLTIVVDASCCADSAEHKDALSLMT